MFVRFLGEKAGCEKYGYVEKILGWEEAKDEEVLAGQPPVCGKCDGPHRRCPPQYPAALSSLQPSAASSPQQPAVPSAPAPQDAATP